MAIRAGIRGTLPCIEVPWQRVDAKRIRGGLGRLAIDTVPVAAMLACMNAADSVERMEKSRALVLHESGVGDGRRRRFGCGVT